jgi:DNA-binding response OmpR family regulator
VRRGKEQAPRIVVVWALPSRLITRIGTVPSYVQLDVMSTAWATLRRLRGQLCHLLLLHLDLPDSTGPALAARVRILHSALPIVLTTDRADDVELGMNLASLRLMGPLQMPVCWAHLLERVLLSSARRDVDSRHPVETGYVREQPVAQGK